MTTTVTIHVNGRYLANVVQINADGVRSAPVIVDGDYEGTSNPGGKRSFSLYHPAVASFEVTEVEVASSNPGDPFQGHGGAGVV